MKTNTLRAKLLNGFFAFTLVFGLCIPSIGSTSAYAQPLDGSSSDSAIVQEEDSNIQDATESTGASDNTDADSPDAIEDNACVTEESKGGLDEIQERPEASVQSDEVVPQADGDVTISVAGFSITGQGIQTSDFPVSGTVMSITTNKAITISNTGTNANSIAVPSGVDAHITFDGVNISAAWPFDIKAGGIAHIVLADGSSNSLSVTSGNYQSPGLHCGTGATVFIDDAVPNSDTSGNPIVPENGMIPAGVVYKDHNGTTRTSEPDRITLLDSLNPGSLSVTGGGQGSGFGGTYSEDGGNMTFNGGNITVYNGAGPTSSGNGENCFGPGIGGGGNAAGTSPSEWITINGGNVIATAAFHGAGIGGGWNQNTKTVASGVVKSTHPSGTGNIRINGGYVESNGGNDGNGFGRGCYGQTQVCNNADYTIIITGGTMIPKGGTNLGVYSMDIGGSGTGTGSDTKADASKAANVIITGGSVFVGTESNGKFRFDGKAYGSYTIEDGKYIPNKDDEVNLITIDLAADLLGGNTAPTDENRKGLNNNVNSWNLRIGGTETNYGAPARFDRGRLYLWLPAEALETTVAVRFSYIDGKNEDGSDIIKTPDELYREKGDGSVLKQYVKFEIPENFFTEGTKAQSTLPDGLLDKVPDMYKPADGGETVNLISKPYDGLSFGVTRLEDMIGDDRVMTSDNKPLTNSAAVVYNYQVYDPVTKKLGAEQSSEHAMPSDAGLMAFVMVSKEYADPTSSDPVKKAFAEAYWGHRATGWCEIQEVPAVVNLYTAEWGTLTKNTDGKTWDWKATTSEDSEPGNRIKLDFDIRSALGTAVTCGIPTGSFQVLVDNVKVGDPIPLTAEAIKAEDGHTFTTAESKYKDDRGANTEANNNNRGLISDRAKVAVQYYLDPTRIDGLLDVLESEATPEIQAEVQTMADSSEDITGVNKNSHKVTVQYIPDINYFEGTEEGFEEAASKPTTIIPVNNDPEVKDEDGTEIKFNDESETSLVKNYSDYHKKNADGTPDETVKPYFNLSFDSKSASPVTWTTTDPAVADVMRDADGKVIYEETTTGELIPRIEVKSCGTTTLTMAQGSNAFYNGQKRVIHLTVIPDPNIVPETEVRVVWENKTRPGLPAAPGDVLEYTIVGSNLTQGSAWQEVVLGDTISDNLTLVPNSVKVAKNFTSPEDLSNLTAADFSEVEFSDLAASNYRTTRDSITLNKGVIGSIYGGQSSAFKFQVTVNDSLTDRDSMTGDNPPTIPNEPTVDGSYGVTETEDLVPGQDSGDPKKLEGDDATKVYPIEADEIPEAVVIPKDPKLPTPKPGPDDPANPDDPSNPDNPDDSNGDNESDITVAKTAKNLTHPEGGKALVGDEIAYSITVANNGKDTCYYWPVIRDTLPVGLEPVAGSFELIKVDGTKVAISDSCYQEVTHTIALYVDDLYGGEKTTLTFKCTVTPDATDIANTAQVFGTTPSEKWKGEHPDPDPTPQPGKDPTKAYIVFDSRGGSGAPDGIEGNPNDAITDAFPTAEPVKTGYVFAGWNTKSDGTGAKVDKYPSSFESTPGTVYYYAQWKEAYPDVPDPEGGDPDPEDRTELAYIKFSANGGHYVNTLTTQADDGIIVSTNGGPVGLVGIPGTAISDTQKATWPTKDQEPVCDGYDFTGWYSAATGGDRVEAYGDSFADAPGTTYYYAQWKKSDPTDDDLPDTPDPGDGEPTPTDETTQAHIVFSANGGFGAPQGIYGVPGSAITETFPTATPVAAGYIFKGWNTARDGSGTKVDSYPANFADTKGTTTYYAQWEKDPNYKPPTNPNWPPQPGTPYSPDPNTPADEYPWDDPDNPFDWDKFFEDKPNVDTPEPAVAGKVLPADPDYKDLRITLSAKNETRMDGYTYVGDEVTYTIKIENLSSPEKSWLDVIARADIPEGLNLIPGSIVLTTADGKTIQVSDDVYNPNTRILALNVGDLAGGEVVSVVFKAEVTLDAINKDIGMTSYAYGTLPSEFDAENESYVKPEPGTAFVPTEGWALFDRTHTAISNVEKVYPSEKVTAQTPPLPNTPEEAEQAAKLAKTSDFMGFAALGVGVIALIAGVALVVARRRMRKEQTRIAQLSLITKHGRTSLLLERVLVSK